MKQYDLTPEPRELFETWLYGTSKEVSWEIANESSNKQLIAEILNEFAKYCEKYGFEYEGKLEEI